MSPDFVDDDSSIGGGSVSRQFRNPLYDCDNEDLEGELAANSYEPGNVPTRWSRVCYTLFNTSISAIVYAKESISKEEESADKTTENPYSYSRF